MTDIKSLYDGFNFGPPPQPKYWQKHFFGASEYVGEFETDYCDIIKNMKDGDVFLDLGASTGAVSWLALKSNNNLKHIYMVEPYPLYIDLIKENFRGVDNYTLIEKAISDKEGERKINWEYKL